MKRDDGSGTTLRLLRKEDIPQVHEIEKQSFLEPWERERFVKMVSPGADPRCIVIEKDEQVIGYFVSHVETGRFHLLSLAIHPAHRRQGHGKRCLECVQRLAAYGAMKTSPDARTVPGFRVSPTGISSTSLPGISSTSLPGISPTSLPGGSSTSLPGVPTSPTNLPGGSLPQSVETAHADEEPEVEIYLEVSERNLAAQCLYRKMGYRATRILRNHYPKREEDAYVMTRKITPADVAAVRKAREGAVGS